MRIVLVTYSDDRFGRKGGVYRGNQLKMIETAKQNGIDKFATWTWDDLVQSYFYKEYKTYLNKSRHENGVVWKPYVILDALQNANDGDIIFYHDAMPWGFHRHIKPLVKLCLKNDGTLFKQAVGHQNYTWTKRDTFVYMDCDSEEYHHGNHMASGWMLIQKNETMIQFVKEWLKYNLDERIASQVKPNTCGVDNLPGFIEHRDDQSIFSLLVIKYGIKSFGVTDSSNVNEFIDLLWIRAYPDFLQRLIRRAYAKLIRKKSPVEGW